MHSLFIGVTHSLGKVLFKKLHFLLWRYWYICLKEDNRCNHLYCSKTFSTVSHSIQLDEMTSIQLDRYII